MGRKKKPALGYVYLIHVVQTSRYKIGYSATSPEIRLKDLQVGNPDTLVLRSVRRGGRDLETALHFHFRHQRIRGEWFNLGGCYHTAVGRFQDWNEEHHRKIDLKLYVDEKLERGRYRILRRFRTYPTTNPPDAKI